MWPFTVLLYFGKICIPLRGFTYTHRKPFYWGLVNGVSVLCVRSKSSNPKFGEGGWTVATLLRNVNLWNSFNCSKYWTSKCYQKQEEKEPQLLWTLNIQFSRLWGSLSPRHGTSSGCGRKRRPPDMEGSCEYTEKVVANSRQRGSSSLVVVRGAEKSWS
jgi:hypothetical protein